MINKYLKSLVIWVVICFFSLHITISSAVALTIGDERKVGEQLLYSVRSSFELIDDPDITQYLTDLGKSVLDVAGIQYFNYHFFVINSKEFNAFAAPSGLLFFFSGLISTMDSENEFVSVIAHEIGHVVKRHLASRMETGKYSTIGSLGLALAAIAFGGALAPVLFTGALAAGQSVNLHFSRKHEEEADLLAYGWMKELHRSPEGQVKMLQSMRRIARYRSEKLPQYLTTHPNPEARLDYVESLMEIDSTEILQDSNKVDNFDFTRFKYRILSKVKDPQQLQIYFSNIISNKNSSESQRMMGKYGLSQIALNENDYAGCLTLLQEVIAHLPEKIILNADKGVCQFEAGNLVKAKTSLNEVLRLKRNDMYATFYMGKLLYKQGNLDEAKQYFKTLSDNQPEYSKVYFELGQIASDQKTIEISNFYLGKYYLFEGKLKLAKSSIQQSLASKALPEKMRKEGEEILEKLKKFKQ